MRGVGWANTIIVLVLLLVVAAVLVPNFIGAKISWNDTSARASLRNLASVQAEFRASGLIDLDGDRVGEFGTLGELTGSAGIRRDPGGNARGPVVNPPVLSPSLASISASGIARRSDYCFRIVLPGRNGEPVREGPPGGPFSGAVDTDGAEARWCAYAWPATDYGELKGESRNHHRVFFVNEAGEVFQSWNRDRRYSSPDGGPSWDAAMPEDGWGVAWASPPKGVEEYRGRDGNLWRRLP